MDTVIKLYEGMFVLPQTLVREDKEKAFGVIKSILEKFEAKTEYMDIWQERPLAYEIKNVRNATYILTYFKAQPEVISKIERLINITDDILRALIIRCEQAVDYENLGDFDDIEPINMDNNIPINTEEVIV